jgi:hypothetical protein
MTLKFVINGKEYIVQASSLVEGAKLAEALAAADL